MIHRIDRVNPDVDDRVIKPNEARMATNLRFGASTEDTNLSGGTLVLGNKEVDFTPPDGISMVKGVYADLESNSVYFALYNSEQRHGIYRISGSTNQVDAIMGTTAIAGNVGAFLNFQPEDEYNVSITVIQGLLYWTDNVNEPRVINIEKGIRTMQGQTEGVYINPSRATNYSQVKRPPGRILDVYRLYNPGDTTARICYNLIYTPENIQKDWTAQSDFTGAKQTTWNKTFVNTDGIQFSYYYVYDNDEDSKLAPWSEPVFYKKDIVIQVPQSEFSTYLEQASIIKKVVFVYRTNNDGIPCVVKSVENIPANYLRPTQLTPFTIFQATDPINRVAIQDIPSIQLLIDDTTYLSKSPVSTDVAEQRFDSVPLLSKTNTVAQNRLNHANYILDRNTWDGLQLSLEVVPVPLPEGTSGTVYISQPAAINIFKPGGIYEIGIELLDEAGRPIGVINTQEVTIPEMRIYSNSYGYSAASPFINNPQAYVANYDDAELNVYRVKYTLTGTLPSWAKYCRVVSSEIKNVNYFHRGVAPIFYWFQASDGTNQILLLQKLAVDDSNQLQKDNPLVFGNLPSTIQNPTTNKVYQYKGYAIDVSNIPVTYSAEENLYLKIGQELSPVLVTDLAQIPTGGPANVQEFKIVGQQGGLMFVETTSQSIYPSVIANKNELTPPNSIQEFWNEPNTIETYFHLLYYNVEIYSRKTPTETVFYQNNIIITPEEFTAANNTITAEAIGDCYVSSFNNTWTSSQTNVAVLTYKQSQLIPETNAVFVEKQIYPNSLTNIPGVFISMNPASARTQTWTWQKGQPGVVNENQREIRIDNGIIFSSPIIQGTQVNGLNQFVSLDSRLAPVENGPICSLVTTNATQREPGVLLSIGANGISSFYYDAIQLTNVDGSNNVITTTTYLASQRPLLGQYGTTRPMSITKTPLGTVYWWSDVVNDLIRYTNAGLERLGMTFSFANYLRQSYRANPLIITWYDQVTDEVSLLGRGKNTAVFSERYKTFQGEREYHLENVTPERGIGIDTKQFLFVEGKIWVTNVQLAGLNAPPNNFIFGKFRDPVVDIVTNESPAAVKRWNQIKVFGKRPYNVQLEAPLDNESYGEALLSSIEQGQWINRKGDWEVAIRRASNTPGGLLAGKLMESRIIYSKFAFSAEGFDKLNFIEVRSNVSIVQ